MKLGEVLANCVINIRKELANSKAYDIASENNLETLEKLSREELKQISFEMCCELVDLVYELGKIETFINVCKENKETH